MTQFYDHDSFADQHLIKREDMNSTSIMGSEEVFYRFYIAIRKT